MAQYRVPDPEDLMECPYDRVHMVRAKRMQYHLIKCRKNYQGSDFQKCPFNAKHHVPRPELRHHIATCPDKAIVEKEISYSNRRDNGEENLFKGYTDTPVYKELNIPTDEDWDAEVSAPVRRGPAFDDQYYERVKFKDMTGLSKDQRSVMKDNRLTSQQKMEEMKLYEKPIPQEGTRNLRLPKTTSIVAMGKQQVQEQPVSSVFTYEMGIACGRGRAAIAPGMAAPTGGVPQNGVGMMANGLHNAPPTGYGRGVGRGMVPPPPGFSGMYKD